MIKVFVHGSLATEGRYHQYCLQGKTLLGKAFLSDHKKYILGGGLDGIFPKEGERVQGEVYEVDQAVLAKLDFLHNNDTIFTKKTVDVALENGETLQAEAYICKGQVR